MRDLVTWSFPIGRLFGISVRVHWSLPLVALGLIARATRPEYVAGSWIDAAQLSLLMFGAVLLHEFGHCFGARSVEGDAHEILMWPLGGLAAVEVPHTARANFLTAAAGPAVNLLLCLVCAPLFLWLTGWAVRPPWNPLWDLWRFDPSGGIKLFTWHGQEYNEYNPAIIALARFMYVNWVLFLLNTLVFGFPLDGGRMFQCALWPRYGFRQATVYAIVAGFLFALLFGLISFGANEVLWLFLALFIYFTCQQQWIILETGGEESLMGYDFSQGYTSLEREAAPPRRRRPSFYQRWQQRRAARKLQQEAEQREAEERRMDELLEKVQREGLQSLTDEERRFLTRVSAKYRNRH